jgi:ferredoxin
MNVDGRSTAGGPPSSTVETVETVEQEAPAPVPKRRPGGDLLRHRPVAVLLRSRLYPGVLRLPVAAVFGLVAYELLRGPDVAGANAGSALMWLLWWPALPVMFLLAGRLWCSVCPFGTISDLVQWLVGIDRPAPRFLRKYGVWIIDAEFLTITWADHVWGVVNSPWGSGVLLLLLTSAVIVSGAFLPRRAFCRYLCFLGGLCGNYARAGAVQLRADPAVCAGCTSRAACYRGTDQVSSCPLFSFPRTLDTAATCNLCGRCLRSCPDDAIAVHTRPLFSELWSITRPQLQESALAMAIMGVVLIQNLSELAGWQPWLYRVSTQTGCPRTLVFTLLFLGTVALPVTLLCGASAVASRRSPEKVLSNFARFGYSLIPLDIAAFIAHTQRDVLGEGRQLYVSLARLVGGHPALGPSALAGPATIRAVQWTTIVAGTAASLYTVRRIVHARYRTPTQRRATLLPYTTLLLLLGGLNLVLFAFPARS